MGYGERQALAGHEKGPALEEEPEELPLSVTRELVDLAAASQIEACGFVVRRGCMVFALQVPNLSMRAHSRFEISTGTQRRVMQQHRVVGLFHTHPSGDSHPSRSDVAGWPRYPGWRYWIATGGGVFEWVKTEEGVHAVGGRGAAR